ncbi:MAG TPA: hypothetical protein VKY71_12105 [Actinotalea caeni]|uniref:hypothetical protein n=1 Tax=Actinotalea caeni TaxID=1348467 RepID=UPI0012E1099D|nr:hypothetical protein [Actinotalea caeni]HLV56304.1 hypothetical protein [Actinotalea caeni]
MIELSDAARTTAGIALVAATTVATGGRLLYTIVVGRLAATDFQKAFFRAGHAHAGVFIVLGLLCLLLTEATSLTGAWQWLARSGVLVAAIVMPMGFFFSAIGTGRTSPNRWVVLLGVGAAFLVAGLLTAGIGLLTA